MIERVLVALGRGPLLPVGCLVFALYLRLYYRGTGH